MTRSETDKSVEETETVEERCVREIDEYLRTAGMDVTLSAKAYGKLMVKIQKSIEAATKSVVAEVYEQHGLL